MSITGRLVGPEAPSPEVVTLDLELFPTPWSPEQWGSLTDGGILLFTWRSHAAALLGFALFGVAEGDVVAHLYKILLRPEFRGTGEARAFWAEASQDLRRRGYSSVYLEVESSNSVAIGFYERLGFTTLRRVRSYYSNGSDAIMMNLTL